MQKLITPATRMGSVAMFLKLLLRGFHSPETKFHVCLKQPNVFHNEK